MIVGKIYFLLVRIKIKHMEIQIIKRESTGTGTPPTAPLISVAVLTVEWPDEYTLTTEMAV